mmetsp:Transcript_11057/g.18736  ORF Transcript_11057/g.18736 Transcript_11057/m.18736 type:complete len:235 (-) Transcript_11057:116-820(-)
MRTQKSSSTLFLSILCFILLLLLSVFCLSLALRTDFSKVRSRRETVGSSDSNESPKTSWRKELSVKWRMRPEPRKARMPSSCLVLSDPSKSIVWRPHLSVSTEVAVPEMTAEYSRNVLRWVLSSFLEKECVHSFDRTSSVSMIEGRSQYPSHRATLKSSVERQRSMRMERHSPEANLSSWCSRNRYSPRFLRNLGMSSKMTASGSTDVTRKDQAVMAPSMSVGFPLGSEKKSPM